MHHPNHIYKKEKYSDRDYFKLDITQLGDFKTNKKTLVYKFIKLRHCDRRISGQYFNYIDIKLFQVRK